MGSELRRYHAPAAWVGGAWAKHAVLTVGADGRWTDVVCDAPAPLQREAQRLKGPILPGLVDAHSHAFQRAIAGLTERCAGDEDDFWRWRDRMYSVANRITPDQLEAVAAFLYAELLRAGYTQVCEFHYLHNDMGGRPYADAAETALALVRAARRAGIGLTLLPALYMRGGFAAKDLREDQRRFASTPQSVLRIADAAARQSGDDGCIAVGVAVHSLRAVEESALRELVGASGAAMPIHIHVAEQQQEVDDCIVRHGKRPIEWLLDNVSIDERWNLVHGTRSTPGELEGVRSKRASIVLCPSSEANLGDGIFDLPGWMGQSGSWSVGSDSHVTRSWQEELRLLEYSQRLGLRQRNVAARSALCESSAAALFGGALAGGTAAAGYPLGGLARGQRADFCVVDMESSSLAGMPSDQLLDAMMFSSPQASLREVYVAGQRQLAEDGDPALALGMRQAMRELWGS